MNEGKIVEKHGYGKRNARGDKLVEFDEQCEF